ncbi:Chain length determinant protein [Tangfeifania diversioriginum]|uniref:Chain length determinant protein n=1 Tax=Tangfeifania diversioriginum TaxID=1168035 RepID=A0A1M6F592_9BACT|nr:Wzz/FepE/Etk N-terminal domain-containing protein [Tangfeifania diversioriginum]SHI92904.1 Chain length determinant protein [Tangfeifania diversioriginum]
MNNFFDNQRILQLIWRRKFHFVIVGVVAIVLAAIFSGPAFIKPKYKSTARIYPTNLWVLSEESESEQMLEIINSRDIKLKMFDAFQLDEVYKINRDDPHYLTYMLDIYNKNVSAAKTKFETIEIQVLDYNPQRASDMCDSIVAFYNKKVREIHKAKDWEMVKISKNGLEKKYNELDTLTAQLNLVRKEYGILDYKSQVEKVTEGYMEALASGRTSSSNTREIRDLYDNLAEQGSEAEWLENRHEFLINAIDSLTTQYETHLSEYEKDITYAHVVEYPVPSDKKSYPVRWLIVAFSAFSAVFVALLVFLVLDYRKKD